MATNRMIDTSVPAPAKSKDGRPQSVGGVRVKEAAPEKIPTKPIK